MSLPTEADGAIISHHFTAYEHSDAIDGCSVSPDGSIAASTSKDRTTRAVYNQGLKHRQTLLLPVESTSRVDISVSANGIATSTFGGNVCVWKPPDFKDKVLTKRCEGKKAIACAMTPDGNRLVSAFCNDGNTSLFITGVSDGNDYCHRQTSGKFYQLIPGASGGIVLFLEWSKNERILIIHLNLWDTMKNTVTRDLLTFKVTKAYPSICTDAKADRVVIADDESLRIWHRRDGSVVSLPNYTSSRSSSCAVTPQGDRIVAAIAGNCFGLWDVNRRIRIATLQGHGDPAPGIKETCCAISNDGATIVTGGTDKTVRVWSIPPVPSPLEVAFGTVLSNPAALDMDLILKNVVSSFVKSTSDLLAGHNLVLLAIRMRVITRDNIRKLGGSQWYLQDNLYLPASKLVNENGALINAVFLHAENLGIIEHGYMLKVARDIRVDVSEQISSLASGIAVLTNRVEIVERRVTDVENRMSTIEDNVSSLHSFVTDLNSAVKGLQSAVEGLQLNQEQMQCSVAGLADNLTRLQKNIRKRDRRMRYAGLARCMLSFIPLLGQTLGEAAYSVSEAVMGLKVDDLLPSGVDAVKSVISSYAHVDLSNFQVARFAFSNNTLSKLVPSVHSAVVAAVAASSFESAVQLEAMLKQEISNIETKDSAMAFVDISSSDWMLGPSPSGDTEDIAARAEKARIWFQHATRNQETGERLMSIETAKVELSLMLKESKGHNEVNVTEIEDTFFKVADKDKDGDMVCEKVFMDMFAILFKEHEDSGVLERLLVGHAERFRERAKPQTSVSLRVAARMIYSLSKELVTGGVLKDEEVVDEEKVLEELVEFDANKSDSIEEEEFIAATKKLLHKVEP